MASQNTRRKLPPPNLAYLILGEAIFSRFAGCRAGSPIQPLFAVAITFSTAERRRYALILNQQI
jgi:hypothetical protein